MSERDLNRDRPLEETPEVLAAVEDETTVPQLMTGNPRERRALTFHPPDEVPAEYPPGADLIGNAFGSSGGAGDRRTGDRRTGAEQPWDPEDLTMAQGHDPTPRHVERARQELEQEGRSAIEKTVP